MNTKRNQRFQKTQAEIKRIFIDLLKKKSIGQITVSEICQQANINRSTFYAHFIDIDDLMEKVEADMSAKMIGNMLDNAKSLGEGFEKLFRFIGENAAFYSAYFVHARNAGILNIIMPDAYEGKIVQVVQEIGITTETEYQYHSCFFKAGITGLIRRWLDGGCVESPREMSAIIHKQYNLNHENMFDWHEGEKTTI